MKEYILDSLILREVGIYYKDIQEVRFQNKLRIELKEILGILRLKAFTVPDILEKLNNITSELNKYYKEI